jgi:hypothetical protein
VCRCHSSADLLTVGTEDRGPQRRDRFVQVSADSSRGYAEDPGCGLGVQVQQQPQRHNFTLTSGQPPQRCQQVAADQRGLLAGQSSRVAS